MKHSMIMAFIALVTLGFISCQSTTEYNPSAKKTVQITIEPFELQMTNFNGTSQKSVNASDAGVTAIKLAIYNNQGESVFTTEQTSTDENFGQFSTELDFGTYTFVTVGYKTAAGATISSKDLVTFSGDNLSDTYSASKTVEISATSSDNISVEMNRLISFIGLTYNNNLPTAVKKLQVIIAKGGKSFNPATGLTTESGVTFTKNVLASEANNSIVFYTFLSAVECTTDITVNGLNDSGETIYTQTLENVPMKQNKKTMASGVLFANTAAGSFTFNNNWEANTNFTW